ncbi:MAG TPA: serine protease [Pseudomonadales bacterium]|nr:serine protease [Pseudomonadales bacterium]
MTEATRRLTGLLLALLCVLPLQAAPPDTIARIKPAILGLGTHQPMGKPPSRLLGTAFVVADGRHAITNAHSLPEALQSDGVEKLVIFIGTAPQLKLREVRVIEVDSDHDLALLGFDGEPLPALRIGDSQQVREGESYLFTGYPIGAVLGLYPVTHHAMVASITPVAVPQISATRISSRMVRELRDPYVVFQLDATAYPGNSGSPLYDPESGAVVGVINKVFVQQSKEAAIEHPSGITYAIPGQHIRQLLRRNGLL